MADNTDYRTMYLKMMHAAEDAMALLIQAQRECEEISIQTVPPEEAET